jgi:hypothetical protein
MDIINQLTISTGFPRWLVILSGVLIAVVVVWVLAKVLKWTLVLVFAALVVVLVLGGLVWLFG